MDTVLTTMFYFWVSLFIVFFLTQRGLWIFSDVAKGTVSFMLEKALGPGSDLVEGTPRILALDHGYCRARYG
jgi:hypothetical protein